MSARWEETLSLWRQFREHWELGLRGDPRGATINNGIDEILARLKNRDEDPGFLLSTIEGTFGETEPIYVSEDVTALWEYAWPSFEPEPPRPTDLLVRNGFALFPHAIDYDQTTNTPKAPCRVLVWVSDGIELWAFGISHRADFPEARSNVWAIEIITGMRLDGDIFDPDQAIDVVRQHQSFWRLAQQVLAAPQGLSRARRREEKRQGSTRKSVTVLRLRRVEQKEPTESVNVEWSRRWIVRGHWRNQWYPSLDVHRQIWISPFVKGPDEKPLVLTQRVVEFVR